MIEIDNLSESQHKFLVAYVTTTTLGDAAKQAGIAYNTAYKYLEDPEFQKAYRIFRSSNLRQLSSKLEAHSLNAINVLVEIMNDESVFPSTRVNAANKIIQLNIEVNQNENLLNRIEEIEKWIEN